MPFAQGEMVRLEFCAGPDVDGGAGCEMEGTFGAMFSSCVELA